MNSSKTRKTQEKYIVKFKFAMKSHFSLTVLTFYFFSYLLICLHWQSYPTIFKGKDFLQKQPNSPNSDGNPFFNFQSWKLSAHNQVAD